MVIKVQQRKKRQKFEAIIKKARTDFRTYALIVGGEGIPGGIRIGDHQKEWVRICQEIGDDPFGDKGYIIVAPPGSGKSYLIAVLFASWMIGRYPTEHFGLISYADKPAWDRAVAVRNVIENSNLYHRIFPNVEKDPQSWGSSGFRVMRSNIADPHPTLRAGGSTSSIVSYRLSGVIIDDPHDPKNTTTPEIKEKVYTNWEQAIRTRLLDGAFRLCITTRWADDDFAGTLMRREEGDWKIIVVKAYNEKGGSYWPEHYSTEFLKKKELTNPETFAIQYMGDTTKGASGIFKELTTYKGEVQKELVKQRIQTGSLEPFSQNYRYMHEEEGELDLILGVGIDTALKKGEDNDYTVMYVGGLDQNGRLWILDRKKSRYMMPELTLEIKELYEQYHPYSIWIEDSAAGTPAVQTLKAELPHLPLVLETPTAGGKRSRALSIQPYINGGYILFPKDASWYADAEYFISRFGSASHDDDVDALYLLISNLLTTGHPSGYDYGNRLQGQLIFK